MSTRNLERVATLYMFLRVVCSKSQNKNYLLKIRLPIKGLLVVFFFAFPLFLFIKAFFLAQSQRPQGSRKTVKKKIKNNDQLSTSLILISVTVPFLFTLTLIKV